MKPQMLRILFCFCVGLCVTSWASAAELLAVRAGETGLKNRLVLVTDANQTWTAHIDQGVLSVQGDKIGTHLPKHIALQRASALGDVEWQHKQQVLVLKSKLTRPMKIHAMYAMPYQKQQPVRWVIDLVPDAAPLQANHVLHDVAKTAHKDVVQPVPVINHKQVKVVHEPTAHDVAQLVELSALKVSADLLNVKPFKGTRDLVIAIDAGHGGKDVGAISASGALEKDITLAMAKELKRQIDAQPGMRAVLTRDDDYFITLTQRPRIAREMGADMFISLHADSYKDQKISGASFYVMSFKGASSQLAKFVAAHSNSADHAYVDGLEPWNVQQADSIGRVAMNASIEDSYKLGNYLKQGLKKSGIRLQHSQVQSANFMVLKNFDMPSILVEMGFISNPQQDQLMQTKQYQTKLATSLVNGLVNFVEVQPEPGVVYANLRTVKGDTLAKIAQRHSTSVAYLAKANGLTEKSPIKVGQTLRVPVNMTRRVALLADAKG